MPSQKKKKTPTDYLQLKRKSAQQVKESEIQIPTEP